MTAGMQTIMYPVTDLEQAKRMFAGLFGTTPYMDESYYVGFRVAGQDVGLDPNGHDKGLVGPTGYWHVPDITEALTALVANGGRKTQDVTDVGGGKLIATVEDADGNVIGLLQFP